MIGRIERMPVALGNRVADLAVRVWEPKGSTASVLCLHGFAGTGQDFEVLAETLCRAGVTVIAPDMIGRGDSAFLGTPEAYSLRAYLVCLTAAAGLQKPLAAQIGTSWGGILMLTWLSTRAFASRGLVLNDVPLRSGPVVQGFRTALREESLRGFPSFEAAAEHVIASRSMEFLTGTARQRFLESRILKVGEVWRMRYDPAVAADYGMDVAFSLLRPLLQAPIPVLMAYGRRSPYGRDPDLPTIAAANPNIRLMPGLDDPHPPSLMKPDQVAQVAGWLSATLGLGQVGAARGQPELDPRQTPEGGE